jgi:5-methylcytosine-specific restriction endonuclease McrA
MQSYSFAHLSDGVAWSSYEAAEAREIAETATTLALLAEVDERKLYLPKGYSCMRDYCMRARYMSQARAEKRIRVARAGRVFPAIFPSIAEGKLGLSAVMLLVPRLKPENADELLAAAAHKTNEAIERFLAERFPSPQLSLAASAIEAGEMEEAVAARPPVPSDAADSPMSMEPVPVSATPNHSGWRYSYSAEREKKLRYLRSLLSHSRPGASVEQVLDLALACLQDKLERQKFGKCSRPGKRRGSSDPRYIPLEVKRAVFERDNGQCAFVGTGGTRCEAHELLEFDHQEAVGRGGQATVANVRLLCRAHNQYAAEQTYGKDFMRGKREQAKARAEKAKSNREAKTQEKAAAKAAKERAEEILPYLRELGYNPQRARRGVQLTMHMLDAPIEERMKVALRGLAPKALHIRPDGTSNYA